MSIAYKRIDFTISWEPLTLHEARGFPVYYISLYDSSTRAKRGLVNEYNSTEPPLTIPDLDSSQSYSVSISVENGEGEVNATKLGLYEI